LLNTRLGRPRPSRACFWLLILTSECTHRGNKRGRRALLRGRHLPASVVAAAPKANAKQRDDTIAICGSACCLINHLLGFLSKKHIQENVVIWDFSFCSEKLIAVNGEAIWMHVADR
jgi:hypothetical protein